MNDLLDKGIELEGKIGTPAMVAIVIMAPILLIALIVKMFD